MNPSLDLSKIRIHLQQFSSHISTISPHYWRVISDLTKQGRNHLRRRKYYLFNAQIRLNLKKQSLVLSCFTKSKKCTEDCLFTTITSQNSLHKRSNYSSEEIKPQNSNFFLTRDILF